jgi:hypothetical protein
VITQAPQTRVKNRSAYIKQYYRWGKANYHYNETDTTYDFTPRFQVAYTLHAEEISYIFENFGDTGSKILPHQYYAIGDSTYDSAYYGKLTNKVQFEYFMNKGLFAFKDSTRALFSAGIRQEMVNVAQNPFIRLYSNWILDASWKEVSLKNNNLLFKADGSYVIGGYNAGDYKASGYLFLAPLGIGLTGSVQSYRPDFSYQLFKTNQFIWENSFDKVYIQELGAGWTSKKWRHNLRIFYTQSLISNWVYTGTDAMPAQFTPTFTLSKIEFNKTFQLWKFYFEHNLYFQKSTADVIRVPAFSGMIRYYIQSLLFKKVLRFQLGFDVWYNTAYYGNFYNPANRQFHLQNEVRIGNYPVIDPFVVFDIKRASLFFKYEHVNQDLIKTGMYTTAHYPMSLGSFRFGVRWRMFN